MFGFFKRKGPGWPKSQFHLRKLRPENPGSTISARTFSTDGVNRWSESFNVLDSLEQSLSKTGINFKRHAEALEDPATGLLIQPRFVSGTYERKDWASSASTIEVSHPTLIPDGAFEYQYSSGESVEKSLCRGFESWIELDLPPILDLMPGTKAKCLYLETETDNGDRRRIILGPVAFRGVTERPHPEEHPPFCTCCFFNQVALQNPVFRTYINSNETQIIRFYGLRLDQQFADCRINGLEFDPGKEAIINYMASWPDLGNEERKQLVAIQSIA